jgi:hypothetical protein
MPDPSVPALSIAVRYIPNHRSGFRPEESLGLLVEATVKKVRESIFSNFFDFISVK